MITLVEQRIVSFKVATDCEFCALVSSSFHMRIVAGKKDSAYRVILNRGIRI